jgi:hypothetical protein
VKKEPKKPKSKKAKNARNSKTSELAKRLFAPEVREAVRREVQDNPRG